MSPRKSSDLRENGHSGNHPLRMVDERLIGAC